MYTTYKDGEFKEGVGKKGVLLARRDNSKFVKDIYEKVVMRIFEYENKEQVLNFILDQMNLLFCGYFPCNDFIMTKSVGNVNNMIRQPVINEKNENKIMIGDYTVPLLPSKEHMEERETQLKNKDAIDEDEYYLKCLPAQVQLAEKMKRRGTRVDAGSRIEYVLLDTGKRKVKQFEKLEDIDYFKKHKSILKLDYMDYLRLLTNPLDQIIKIVFKEDNFLQKHHKYRENRNKLNEEFLHLTQPTLKFED